MSFNPLAGWTVASLVPHLVENPTVMEFDKILLEVRRVLKKDGMFIVDILYGYEEGYSAGYHDCMHWTTARHFSEHLADKGGFAVQSFRDLEKHGSKFWKQSIMRKS